MFVCPKELANWILTKKNVFVIFKIEMNDWSKRQFALSISFEEKDFIGGSKFVSLSKDKKKKYTKYDSMMTW